MSPYKIKYRVITANNIEDAATDNLLDDYDQALELAGKYFSEQGCVVMDLFLVGFIADYTPQYMTTGR